MSSRGLSNSLNSFTESVFQKNGPGSGLQLIRGQGYDYRSVVHYSLWIARPSQGPHRHSTRVDLGGRGIGTYPEILGVQKLEPSRWGPLGGWGSRGGGGVGVRAGPAPPGSLPRDGKSVPWICMARSKPRSVHIPRVRICIMYTVIENSGFVIRFTVSVYCIGVWSRIQAKDHGLRTVQRSCVSDLKPLTPTPGEHCWGGQIRRAPVSSKPVRGRVRCGWRFQQCRLYPVGGWRQKGGGRWRQKQPKCEVMGRSCRAPSTWPKHRR